MRQETMVMPMVALRDIAVLPGMLLHFDVNRRASVLAIEQAMKSDQQIFTVMQKDSSVNDPKQEDLYSIGCIAKIKQIIKLPGNLIRVLATGERRGELDYLVSVSPYFSAQVTIADAELSDECENVPKKAYLHTLRELTEMIQNENPKASKDVTAQLLAIPDLDFLMEQAMVLLPLDPKKRQMLFEAAGFKQRYEMLLATLSEELEELRIRKDLQSKVKAKVDHNQKEYVLREQMKVIREELGETGEADEFMQKLETLSVTEETKKAIAKEIDRYQRVSGSSSESAVARTYVETLLEMPWEKKSEESVELQKAAEILDRDHYGLQKIKERILQYLAVRKRTGKANGTILCLIGPPGTGKTSIARSVAEALGKEYVRVCLGGVRDEAEIRGHRRTYIGAMPGRIAAGIKSAGVKNPLMLLDEIDKLSTDYKGDPSSALLEVLDPEQNAHFVDHYIDLPMDLSEVLFIATANSADTIPAPLWDRMEAIELSGYTENEKFFIAKNHLWNKELSKNGLKSKELKITDGAIKTVISDYTREAGVRKLEQSLGEICRKAVWKLDTEEETKTLRVTDKNLAEFLGKKKYRKEKTEKKPQIGFVCGLAWTKVGGTILEMEVNAVPDEKGGMSSTGQLGEVMAESVELAYTYVKSVCKGKTEREFLLKNHLHLHAPEGAVPKDGPSAGITIATAIYSVVTHTPVRSDIAMTGEISLRGKVLPIGGLKEKLLAAKQAGAKTVLVPEKNRPDVEEMEAEITDGLRVVFVSEMKEVLAEALVK